jgi:hypothetical protein
MLSGSLRETKGDRAMFVSSPAVSDEFTICSQKTWNQMGSHSHPIDIVNGWG